MVKHLNLLTKKLLVFQVIPSIFSEKYDSILQILSTSEGFPLTSAPRPKDLFVVKIKLPCSYLHRKDPSAFFSFPVTDFIAPGYSMIIKHPMDFSTMKEKIKNNDYQSIEELKVTLVLIHVVFGQTRAVAQSDIFTHSRGRLVGPRHRVVVEVCTSAPSLSD